MVRGCTIRPAVIALTTSFMCFAAGCYTYAPADVSSVRPAAGVRATVSTAAATRIAPLLGTTDAHVLTGTLIESSSGTLLIEVPTTVRAGVGEAQQSLFQRVSIAPNELVDLETRTLDRRRTALVVGGVALLAGSAALAALRGGPTSDLPPRTSPAETRIPVLRFHF